MNYEAFFRGQLDGIRQEGRYRVFADLERCAGDFPRATLHRHGRTSEVTVWCSNDYLGMGQNRNVLAAMHEALDRCGAGAGGTRNISGTNHYHVLLERELASLHGKEAALLFTSGYVSNWAALGTLASQLPGCIVLSDAKNHASMIEGIRHSRAQCRVFAHSDPRDLERKLADLDPHAPKLVAFESVYSMDGDIAPIDELCDVADAHGAMTYLDEVHGVGLYGPRGGGVAERERHQERVATVRARLDQLGIPHLPNESHIVPVMVGDPVRCKRISDILLEHYGIYAQPINYPTVPRGTERLRLTPSPVHTDADIERLISALGAIWAELELKQAA